MRGNDACVRQTAAQLLGDSPLMLRVAIRMQQADRDRIRLDVRQGRQIERLCLTLGREATAHAVAALERHERLGPVGARPVQLGPRLAPQMQ